MLLFFVNIDCKRVNNKLICENYRVGVREKMMKIGVFSLDRMTLI